MQPWCPKTILWWVWIRLNCLSMRKNENYPYCNNIIDIIFHNLYVVRNFKLWSLDKEYSHWIVIWAWTKYSILEIKFTNYFLRLLSCYNFQETIFSQDFITNVSCIFFETKKLEDVLTKQIIQDSIIFYVTFFLKCCRERERKRARQNE